MTKYKVTGEVKQGGGLPEGWEAFKSVYVYAKPKKGASIKKDPDKKQGVWYENCSAPNPVELWTFDQGQEPESLLKSSHPYGLWGYKPGENPNKCKPEDIWFFPPKAGTPKFFTPKGIWSYPVMKRDEEALDPESAGFLHVGNAEKQEALDVAGQWRMLYQRPGEAKGPGVKGPGVKEPMKVHVRTPKGKIITVDVSPKDTIDQVKDKVNDKAGIPKDEQRLQHKNKPLQDPQTLDECGIKNNDTLDLEPMQIFVKDPRGNKYTLDVDPTDKIDQVKTQLEKQEKIPKDEQRLTFSRKPCVDNKNLRDHGIQHKSILQLEPMQIIVKNPTGKTYTLDVDPTDTIDNVKSKLERQAEIPKEDQRLTFANKPCVDKKNLRDHGIKHQSILNLEPMQIFVKDPKGKKYTLTVNPKDKIDDVKSKLENQEGIPKENQRLTFDNKPCVDKINLRDHGIQHQSVLNLEPMQIVVKDPKGKKYTLTVDPKDKIDDVKSKLEKQEGIPKENQRLTFNNKPCVDQKSLRDHDIKHQSVLNLEPMEIFVKTPTGKKVPLQVEPTDTIDDVKSKLENKENIPKDDQRLKFKGTPCTDKKNLRDHGIKHQDVLDLQPMQIFVKEPNGKKYTLDVNPTDKIDDVKDKLENQEGIPKEQQRLTFNGKPCVDQKNLKDHRIKHQSVLDLEPMQVVIQDPKGKKYTVDVNPSDKIDDVKSKLEEQEGIPKDDQRLTFKGKPCVDENTLKEHDIQHQSVLQLEPMQIYVKDHKGNQQYTLDVQPTDTIDQVKTKLDKQERIPKKQQRLTFSGTPCVDNEQLRDHGIKHQSVLQLEPMIVYVKTAQNKKIKLQVEPTDSIDDIKTQVDRLERIPKEDQRIAFKGKPLTDDKSTLQDNKVQHNDTLDLEPMHVIIKDWKGKKFQLPVEPDETIDSIKDKIEAKEGVPKKIQYLNFGGKNLKDPQNLQDYGIKHKDVINLDRMKIYVKDWKGKTFTLEVDPDEPVKDVKKQIEKREELPVKDQVLKFHGDVMENPQGLDDYNVKYKDTVNLSKYDPGTYVVKLTPYKSPLEAGYKSPVKKKREGVRANTKELYKHRWHADLESEHAEMALKSMDKSPKSPKKK